MHPKAVLSMKISAVVAVTPNYGIGMSGVLPWNASGVRLPMEMQYFKKATSETSSLEFSNAVLMGRRTWEGISDKYRPLSGRINLVLTHNISWAEEHLPRGVYRVDSLQHAVELASNGGLGKVERLVVIGGVQLFEEALFHPLCDSYHVSFIQQEFDCDTYLTPATISALQSLIPVAETPIVVENGVQWSTKVFDPSMRNSASDDSKLWF